MSYRDNQTGFPTGLLQSRARIKKNNYALLPPCGLVKNRVPGFELCEMTILASPKLGAGFVDYLVTMLPGGKNNQGFGGNGIETFVYVLAGSIEAGDGETVFSLTSGGYLFVPAHCKLYLKNAAASTAELFLYKRRYIPLEGHMPSTVCGNADALASYDCEGMKDVQLKDLLPTEDLAFDVNFHILSLTHGASHGYIETHVQEHGALVLEGEGMYNLDNEWIPVQKGDYIFMAPYALQASYAIGRKPRFCYLFSKDANRDAVI